MIRMPAPIREDHETVTFARSDLAALVEAIEEVEAVAAHAATRGEEKLPAAVARRLAAGESPVRVFRELRALTGAALAERSGISPSYLSEIETGRKPGSAAALRNLARALSVEIEDLVP
jgi:hypothetical protein